jgi:cytoskeletal protein RodZ
VEKFIVCGMPTVAEQLRAARESKNLTIHEVAEITKMRTDHIRALEDGNFDVFVAPVYIRGFTRTYATLLKLDVVPLMKSLDGELGKTEKFSEPPRLSDNDKGALDFVMLQFSKVNLRSGGMVLGVLIVAGIIWFIVSAMNKNRNADPAKNLPPARYQSPTRNPDNTLPISQPQPRRQ